MQKKWRGKAAGPAGPMSSRWYTSQTINDDLVLLLYDDYFIFVIILRAKAPSLVTNDEPAHFIIECSHSVTKLVIVTSESSLMNTFLVVNICLLSHVSLNICNFSHYFMTPCVYAYDHEWIHVDG